MTTHEDDMMYRFFAYAHPHEAHDDDPERFWAFFHGEQPNVSREEMTRMLDETKGETT